MGNNDGEGRRKYRRYRYLIVRSTSSYGREEETSYVVRLFTEERETSYVGCLLTEKEVTSCVVRLLTEGGTSYVVRLLVEGRKRRRT